MTPLTSIVDCIENSQVFRLPLFFALLQGPTEQASDSPETYFPQTLLWRRRTLSPDDALGSRTGRNAISPNSPFLLAA